MMKEAEKDPVSNYSLTETPWYFGAYLNMARHNMFLLINHLTERFPYLGFDPIKDDRDISNNTHLLANIFDFKQEKFEDERFKVYKYLLKRHYLPCIKIFHTKKGKDLDKNPEVEYKKLHKFLVSSFQAITELRNSYSHYLAIDDNGEKVEERKRSINVDINNVDIKQDIEKLFELSPEFSLERFKQTQQEEDYKHTDSYKLFEDDNDTAQLTEHGFYFFVNLFLERSYAAKFLKKIKGFKDERTPAFRATLQVFTAYSLKVPDVRLESSDKKYSLLLDMLNELQRCPKELFNHLSDEDKKKFEPSIGEKEKSNIVLNRINYEKIEDKDIDQLLAELSTLKRYKNKFPYYALRFIDEYNLLPNIRFQITLGRLTLKNYPKKITGVETNRRVLKTIKAFGRLSDFEYKEATVLEILKGKESKEEIVLEQLKEEYKNDEKLNFEQYFPHYNLNNNKIPFYCIDEAEPTNKPTGFISLNALPKLVLLAYYSPNAVENTIKNYLQQNKDHILNREYLAGLKEELSFTPKQFTRRYIRENKIKDEKGRTAFLTEEKEKELLEHELTELSQDDYNRKFPKKKNKEREYADQTRYRAFLKERREGLKSKLGEKILVYQLPKQVLDYLMNISNADSQRLIHRKIKAIHQDTKSRLKAIKEETKKDKEAQNIKIGELATFLARDIINMVVDEELKKRITSPYYNRLQNKIAYFSISKQEIIEICNKDELNLFDKDKGHVFLSKDLINDATGIKEFYKAYLEAKDKWIETDLFEKGKEGGYTLSKTDCIPYRFQKIKKAGNKDFERWLANKKTMPIDLPNSLFDETLERQLSNDKLHKNKISIREEDTYSILLEKRLKQDSQPFYKYIRTYKHNKEEKQLDIVDKTSKEIKANYGKHAKENERVIRFIQTQDRILKLLCDRILSEDKSIGLQEEIHLKTISLYSENSPLNSAAVFKQSIGKVFTVIAKDNDNQRKEVETYKQLKTEEEKEAYQKQKGYEWTMKDFGRFKRMVADRRIPKLSTYFEDKEVSFDLLIYQLKEYDKYREKIFKLTFDLEKDITDKYFEEIKEIEFRKGKRYFNEVQFNVFIEWVREKGKLTAEEIDKLKEIRNSFSHSQFPKAEMDKLTTEDINNFENKKRRKGDIEALNLSIAKKVYNLYEKNNRRNSSSLTL